MKHEDEGRLMAYVDGELAAVEASSVDAHVGHCPDCALAAARLRSEKQRARAALSELDVDGTEAARRVAARLASRGVAAASARSPYSAPGSWWARRTRVLQAALLVLFVAGGASALVPGSPLRRLLEGGPAEPVEPAPAPLREQETPTSSAAEVGISTAPAAGRLRVALTLPPGTDLQVVFVEGAQASVFASPETRFRSAAGMLEAVVSGGPVRVELPRRAGDVSLEVGGQLYVSMQNGLVQLTVPAADSSDAGLSFRIR